jgi:hypothetical protein
MVEDQLVSKSSWIRFLVSMPIPVLLPYGAQDGMYADDHRPPHFHVVSPDFQVLVRISDLTVIAGEARPGQIADALSWAREHREYLALRWAELNERG